MMSDFVDDSTDTTPLPPSDRLSILDVNNASAWPRYKEGSIFESTVIEVSKSIEVADEMARTSALSVMATACQGLVDIEFPNGKQVPTSLMTLTIAKGGERKSAVDSWFSQPLLDFQIQKERDAESQESANTRLYKNWRIKERALENSLDKAFRGKSDDLEIKNIENQLLLLKSQEPCPPRDIKVYYEDATPGALAQSLYKKLPIACLASSDAGDLLNGPTFRDQSLFNSLWTGSSFSVDRSSTPSFTLHQPRLTVLLMLQPVAIEKFLKKKGYEAHGNGFLSRFLVVKPKEMAGKRTGDMPPVPDEIKSKFYARANELISRSVDLFEKQEKRYTLKLSSKAKNTWKKKFDLIEKQMSKGGIYYHEQEHASKLMDNISRIAGVIHTFEGYEGDVTSETIEYAYRLGRKYSQQYLDNVSPEPEVVKLTNLLVQDIQKLATLNYDGFMFKKSLIQQRGAGMLRDTDSRQMAFDMLEQLGHLRCPSHHGGEYEFKMKVWTTFEPEIRNGEEYTISELPLWEQHELKSPVGSGRYIPTLTVPEKYAKNH
ncbi:YfjI family protein [Chromohalobacter sp. 48-RD10]|uniref:YfjI family protein n=1 Tax=Chromohalobacter sp. 48-RD10 TaxID=2994063 RepID=UPI0024683DC7|nr:YfjI family protein [Chromohalobacter sp. 48-RD10]